VVQLDVTRVVGGDLVKVMCWYDNEWGFTNQIVRKHYRNSARRRRLPV
jgi:glyceraldehyde-3-phosphate dehydrogenase/erythrose-4-phosphate dehydrogenase